MPTAQEQMDQIAASLKIDTSNPAKIRQRIEMLELLLERSLTIPGINFPIGLDAIVGLVPVIGGNGRLYHLGGPQPWHVEMAAMADGGQYPGGYRGGCGAICRGYI